MALQVSRPLQWDNSTLIKGNVAQEIANLKREAGGEISISGSPTLVGSLLKEEGLIDELRLMVHPVVVGRGKRLPLPPNRRTKSKQPQAL